jgi:hypothetical protein
MMNNHTPDHTITQAEITQLEISRLHRRQVYRRWLTVGLCWLVLAPLSLWAVRDELALMHDYFTWVALRYAIAYNRLPAIGLGFCIAITISTLVWQSCNILFGFSPGYQKQLLRQADRRRR